MKAVLLAIVFSLALVSSVLAVDFSAVILDENGNPVIDDPTAKPPVTVTLGMLCVHSLFASFPDETNLDPKVKFERGQLGLDISKATGNLDLTAEQTAMVKALIGKAFGPLIVVRAWALLDPASVKPAP